MPHQESNSKIRRYKNPNHIKSCSKYPVLLVIKDNKDTYIVVFDGFVNIL